MKPGIAMLAMAMVFKSPLTWAADPAIDNELTQIQSQLDQLRAQYGERQKECEQKFNVTDCSVRLKLERSQALQPLIERQRLLQQEQRQQKADARRSDLEHKHKEHELRHTPATASGQSPAYEPVRP